MVSLIILIFAAIIALQAPGLIKGRLWKELTVFSIMLSFGLIYSVGQIYRWQLPNPTKRMEYLFVPAWNMLEKILS
ncbi:MAG: hypothetical protein PHT62_00060 [Desulfotomaculaceae bacterium]|nr:hypothetical protein [Desulfotomaculaceae bacterium]